MAFATLALVAASLFTGAAFYVGFAEHPARMSLSPAEALRQWQPAYERGAVMQIALVAVSAVSGLLAAILTGDWRWLLGAALIAANIPYTLLVIMPINGRLKAIEPAAADAATSIMLDQWARLHVNRTLLGLAAVLVFCWAL